jgi:inhibitor of KinA sporulation pathway (predicted exonuclease)
MEKDNRNHFNRRGKKTSNKKGKMSRDIALIIDFEATCWNHKTPDGMHNEIIEIGISGVDYVTKEIKLRDTIIVKPEFSEISDFCTGLTTITQEFVDEHGVTFAEACEILETKYKSRDRIWLSWGEYDKNIIAANCELKGIRNPFGRTHINMKPLFSFAFGIKTDLGVVQALDRLGMDFEGTAHRGGDDAYNIARILQQTFLPVMQNPRYNHRDEFKKEHDLNIAHIDKMYNEIDLHNNVTRIINKTTPSK